MSVRKEISLLAIVRVILGSVEVMRASAWGTGHLQSSAVRPKRQGRAELNPRRLGRVGSEESCSGPGEDVWVPGKGFGQLTF